MSRHEPNIESVRITGSLRRLHGRITKEDIRSAGLRRWNGRSRVTTDWFNLFHVGYICTMYSQANQLTPAGARIVFSNR